MSALPVIAIIVWIVVSIARKTMGQQQPPRQQMPPRQVPSRPASEKPQSAWEWMHGAQTDTEKDPEGETQMYRDVPEEWIHPVETSVKMDLTEMHESQHEIVHASVRDSIHVRRERANDATYASQATPKKKNKIALNSSNLSQALILSEVLGEPRSKRPWNPRGKR